MENPTVDVVIPVYNGQDFILDAIESTKFQTYSPSKIIVVDDGSTDRTPEVVCERFGRDPQVVYVHQENRGPSAARNRGIRESRAEFIALLDADDTWSPDKIDSQVEVFRKSKDVRLGVVYCDYTTVDVAGTPLADPKGFKFDSNLRGDIFVHLLAGNRLAGSDSAALVRRECFEAAGLFDEALPSCEDWDMWLRLARLYHVDHVAKPLVQLRRHPASIQRNRRQMFEGYGIFFSKWAHEAAGRPAVIAAWRKDFGMYIISTILRDLPETGLYRLLRSNMSPELKRLAIRQLPQIGFGLVHEFLRQLCETG